MGNETQSVSSASEDELDSDEERKLKNWVLNGDYEALAQLFKDYPEDSIQLRETALLFAISNECFNLVYILLNQSEISPVLRGTLELAIDSK